VELIFPTCTVEFQGQSHTKTLKEEDIMYLVNSKFAAWKTFIMKQHFRLELNIGSDEPLPVVIECNQGEGLSESEKDPRQLFPATEEEKTKIEATRGHVTAWFPI